MAGLWTVNLGYGREELTEAAVRQIRKLSDAATSDEMMGRMVEILAESLEGTGTSISEPAPGA